MNEIVVDLNQELMSLELTEPLDPAGLVGVGRVVGDAVDFVILFIRLTVIILLQLHLLLLSGDGGLLRQHLIVYRSRCFHFRS